MKQLVLAALALVSSILAGAGFNGHKVSEGPLTLTIASISTVTNFDTSQPVHVSVVNTSAAPVVVRLELTGLIDECVAVGETVRLVQVAAQGETNATFGFSLKRGSHSALYPVHVRGRFTHGGQTLLTHAIQIFESGVPTSAAIVPDTIQVPNSGAVHLANYKKGRVVWQRFNQLPQILNPGWQGSEGESGTSFGRGPVARGDSKPALTLHPPYKGGAGTVFVEYKVKLPAGVPVQFLSALAIRDHTESEPPSDGVTFRVWIGEEQILERHTDSKVWVPVEVDLARWAGQEILLRLETHPGPKRDTTCDSAFWGDPVLRAGPAPRLLSEAEKSALAADARAAIRSGRGEARVLVFALQSGHRAAVALGPNGIADAAVALGTGTNAVVFDGIQVALFDEAQGTGTAGLEVSKVERLKDSRMRIHHRAGNETLLAELWSDGPGLRLKLSSPARITDLAPGRADRTAARVYYGHGYCLVDPGSFRAGGGGHNLATSHVGLEFDERLALLTACDTPPDYFQVNGSERIYALHTHPDTTFTFVPGTNAFDCALKYRPLYDKQAAPALARKAGRFVFDIWGGRYAQDAALLRRCFDYGLTNSFAIMHVWQRWGYDYRLPDIFPPLPSLGTLEELRELGRACDAAGALWGLHDNYIDIYPDATGFNYEQVTFDADGHPRKAWLNEGRQAQSYQFRPDRVRPFLERNLKLIAPALNPSGSFVDVWTSINAFDYYDRQGGFHSKTETLRHWGEAFALIRDSFGGGPTTSEAGSDQLIGWLEGADCQFMQIGEGKPFNNAAPCRDWERVPWFDVVNHSRFSLHGVGYSSRYEGGRSRFDHGIESDDYISAEMLTGHALMIDLPGMVRGAVRKYWLAQDFIESIALDDIAAVQYAGGDIHRQTITWKSGARVHVNRGSNDWHIASRILPPYGYLAQNGGLQSSIERIDGVVVEQSRAPGHDYYNGRGYNPNAPLSIRPEAKYVEHLGARSFRLVVDWQADAPAPSDLSVFYHFSRPTPGRYTDTEFNGGGKPQPPTSAWAGRVITGTNWTVGIPPGMPLGEYDVLVGLYDPNGGQRYRLLGDETSGRRYLVGTLIVDGAVQAGATNITSVRLKKPVLAAANTSPAINRSPVNFGSVITSGGFRLVRDSQSLVFLPLPDGNDFTIECASGLFRGREPKALHAIDARGAALRPVGFATGPTRFSFRVDKNDFGYRLDLTP